MSQYAGLAPSWAADAALVYGPLARHLVARLPGPARGRLALDAGAGSGLAGDALRALGAHVVAADRELDMVVHGAQSGRAVAADVTALPFRDGSFEIVVAAFVVNHLSDPVAGLTELRRVTRPGGCVLASTFGVDRAAAKTAIDDVAASYGFVRPRWYADLLACAEAIGDAGSLRRVLTLAGFAEPALTEAPVDVGISDPEDVVRYRLGLPHLHPFVAGLPSDVRAAFTGDAVEAVRRTGRRFAPVVVEAVAVA